jgi:putative salt-induced outer membrane protein YdiY
MLTLISLLLAHAPAPDVAAPPAAESAAPLVAAPSTAPAPAAASAPAEAGSAVAPDPARAAAASAPEDPPPLHDWTGSISAGLNVTDGNSNTLSGSASADALYRREKDRTTLHFLWTYKDDEDASPHLSDRKTYGSAQYDYFLMDKTYVLARASGEADLAAELDLRSILTAGLGRQFREDEVWKLAGEGGVSYIDEDFDGTADDDEFLAGFLAYHVAWKPNAKWDLGQDAEIYPVLDDIHEIKSRLDTRARYVLSERLFAQLQWIWDWDRSPASGSEPSDHTVLMTIGYSF